MLWKIKEAILVLLFTIFWIPASAFPSMILFERLRPIRPTAEKLAQGIGPDSSWYHIAKNFYTEMLRADAQWWGKCLSFLIVALVINAFYNRYKELRNGKG
jgi:hypothetical protein